MPDGLCHFGKRGPESESDDYDNDESGLFGIDSWPILGSLARRRVQRSRHSLQSWSRDRRGQVSWLGLFGSQRLTRSTEMGARGHNLGMHLPDEALASFSICILLLLLITAMLVGYFLRKWGISYVQEAGVALALGVMAGLAVQYISGDEAEQKWFTFQPRFFFLFLLPPIIFDSGFGLNMKAFFRNFVSICMFAFWGTFVSALVFGLIIYYGGVLGICYQLPLLEAFLFGTLISATDPVTVLAIFHSLKVEPKMYSLVFGESVLNDAVAIVLYKTLVSFKGQEVSVKSCGLAIGQFLTIFVGSFSIGTGVALLSSLLFKKASFARSKDTDTTLQVAIAVLFPYLAYMIAEGLTLSGIVAILFTGATMAHYTSKNLGNEASTQLRSFFRVVTSLAETFIFIYIGEEMFLANQTWKHISLTGVAFGAVLISRVFNIFPGAWMLNLFTKKPERKIPFTYQKMLWFSGLRGGIAFALALETFKDIPENHAQVGPSLSLSLSLSLTLSHSLSLSLSFASLPPPSIIRRLED